MEKKTLLEIVGVCSILGLLLALLMFIFRKNYTVSS
jgi:hypothetical protein